MGSKRLKAIAINPSPESLGRVELYDREAFRKEVQRQIEAYRANPKSFETFCKYGTTTVVDVANNTLGIWPTRNFRYGQQDNWQRLACEEYDKLTRGHFGCYRCMLNCGKSHTVSVGPYAGVTAEGPEYESIWAFSGTIDSIDVGATVLADKLCDDFGLDTISTGCTIGFTYELFEKGILTASDTDGLSLTYGNSEAMIALIKKIAFREGFGSLLAEGTVRAAQHIGKGAQSYAMAVKGQEMPAYDPRGAKAHGLNYATSNVGANHCVGYARQEISGIPIPQVVDRFDEQGKGRITKYNQDMSALTETGVACLFPVNRSWISLPLFANLLTFATGITEFGDLTYLWQVGERIYNLERAFNVREGFRRKGDMLPERILNTPLHGGASEGQIVRNIDAMLNEYYEVRGWTYDGTPTFNKLKELGLAPVIEEFKRLGIQC